MATENFRDPHTVVIGIIEVAKKYDIYQGIFKSRIDDLESSIRFSAPEIRYSPNFYGNILKIMSECFPITQGTVIDGYYKEFQNVIQGTKN